MSHNILFVDDRTKRIEYAIETFAPPLWNLKIATCVPEALRQLCSREFVVVSLDHDLNGHDFQDPDTPTCGMEIVRYIEKCGGWVIPFEKPDFWIHSSNLFAANLMIVRLKKMGLQAEFHPVKYKVENMTYDEKGNPK